MAPLPHHRDSRIEVRKGCVGPFENNVYVVVSVATGRSVIIDAAAEPDRVAALTAGTTPVAILTTHGHSDHVAAARSIADRFAIPFRLHPDDAEMAGIDPDEPLEEGPLLVGDLTVDAIHTPGHTPGSICFRFDGFVCSGDTLFPGGPGATRGPGADFDTIIASIDDRLFTLDDTTVVLPGHGLDTTIGTERPQLAAWVERGW